MRRIAIRSCETVELDPLGEFIAKKNEGVELGLSLSNVLKAISDGFIHDVEQNVVWVGIRKAFCYQQGVDDDLALVAGLVMLASLYLKGCGEVFSVRGLHNQHPIDITFDAVCVGVELLFSCDELEVLESVLILRWQENLVDPSHDVSNRTMSILFHLSLALAKLVEQ